MEGSENIEFTRSLPFQREFPVGFWRFLRNLHRPNEDVQPNTIFVLNSLNASRDTTRDDVEVPIVFCCFLHSITFELQKKMQLGFQRLNLPVTARQSQGP